MSSRKKILFTIPTLTGGGAERVFTTYIRSLDTSLWDISLLLVKKEGVFLEQIPENVDIYSLNKRRTRFGFFAFIRAINSINPELIVATSNYLNILLLMISFFLKKKPIICLYEQSMPSAQFSYRYFPIYYKWLMQLFYRKADYIIAQTKEMKEEIKEYYSTPKNEIIVSINPIDVENILKQSITINNPYNSHDINIIISGRIREEKGQDFLINAFKRVVDNNPRFKLHILGSIDDKYFYNELLALIDKLNMGGNINFLGFMNNPYPYYKYADLLVLSSRWEGLPNVVLESLFLRTPVVVTNCIPYFSRLIGNKKIGKIVEFGDEIGMSKAILRYGSYSVEAEAFQLVDLDRLFSKMLNYA